MIVTISLWAAGILIPSLIAWNVRLQHTINTMKTDISDNTQSIAINSAEDRQLRESVTSLINKIDDIATNVNDIKVNIAYQKGLNKSGK